MENYRPIAILNNFSKIFEQVIYQSILYNVRPYISDHQHGFLPGRSTVSNLATLSQDISEILDKRGQVDVIYTDFSKAFDTLPHDLLLEKLSSMGAAPSVIKLFRSYLSHRLNYVHYNGFRSCEFITTSGVPQGSNLGPLLFIVFVNDLLLSFSVSALAYADDLKLYSKISSPEDSDLLQHNIDKLTIWCQNNQLVLNISKCCIMTYARKKNLHIFEYKIANTPIKRVTEMKDLGVTFSFNLNFDTHINSICLSASQMLGFVLRLTREFDDLCALKVLYFAFVISKLEYASLIWYPYYANQNVLLERIHRRFLKCLSYKIDGCYPERGISQDSLLERHHMSSLATRRDLHCAKYMKNIVDGIVDAPFLLSKINFYVPRATARFSSSFYPTAPKSNTLRRAPINIMCKNADALINDIFR